MLFVRLQWSWMGHNAPNFCRFCSLSQPQEPRLFTTPLADSTPFGLPARPVHVAYSTEKSDPLMSRMKMAVWEKRNKCYSLKCFDSIPLQIAIGYGFEKRTCFFKRWCSFTCKRKWFSSLKLIWKVQLSLGIPANLPEDPKFRVTMLTGVDGSLK